MSDPSTSAMLHGPGGLLSTPGLGTRRRKRKWGTRLKDKQIVGNLYRSDTGKFTAGSGPSSDAPPSFGKAPKKPRKGRAPAAAKKPKKVAQTPDEKRAARAAEQAQNRAKVLAGMNIAPDGQAALEALRSGAAPDPNAIERGGFVKAGLVEQASDGSYRMTASGRAALAAAASGDAGRAGDTISSARDRLSTRQGKQQAATARREQVAARRAEAAKRRAKKASAKPSGDIRQGAGDITRRATAKSFAVYKDHTTGAARWIARTTTAYRDRDNEIISEAALDADSQRMTATKQFGPLRYWHVGSPDPFDAANPAGPGLDIGDCDYSVVIGRTRIESGTFRNAGIAQKMAAAADRHEMSPGFFHPLDQPDSGGVFDTIRTFERSVVPTRYGRGSNLFTGFTVKEFRMELSEMERRFKAMYSELGLTPEQGMEVGQQLVATEKTAQAQGIAFKSDDTAQVSGPMPGQRFKASNGTEYVKSPSDLDPTGDYYAVAATKAFPPKADDTAAPVEEVKADAPPTPAMAEEVIEPEAGSASAGEYIGDMSWDEFSAKLTELLAPVLKMQDMVKNIGDAHAELKTMYGGVATKDAGTLAEIASLKARLSEIEGDQPATILPDEVAEALKSAGPAKPDEPERKQIVSTPDRPWAGWGAQTFPELYQNGENA